MSKATINSLYIALTDNPEGVQVIADRADMNWRTAKRWLELIYFIQNYEQINRGMRSDHDWFIEDMGWLIKKKKSGKPVYSRRKLE